MQCPACGQLNSDEVSACLSCGQPLYMGGASVDTARADDKGHMVIAGNIDEPLPPPPPKPVSSQLPKPPSLAKLKVGATVPPEQETPTPADMAETEPPVKPRPSPIPPAPASPSADAPPLAAPMGRPTHMIYAGFRYRFLAWVIDLVILGAVQGALATIILMTSAAFAFRDNDLSDAPLWIFAGAQGVALAAGLVLSLLYFTWSESSRWQGTLGKLALGLKVTDSNGGRLSFRRALARFVAHLLSNLTLGLGYVLNAFTPRQQTLHDLVAGTLVVYKDVAPADLAYNPAAPARPAQRASVLLVWVMSALLLVSVALVARSLITVPAHRTAGIDVKIHDAEMLGAQATTAAADYRETHGHFPPTLDAAGFRQSSPQVRRLWIDTDSGVIHLEMAFAPLRKKTLNFVPEFDRDGDLIWRCRSDDIDPQYLPEHCR